MKAIDLSTLGTKELITLHNALAEKEVKGFKSKEDGATAVTGLLETHSKGKDNKAKLLIAVSKMPIAILTVLAAGIPLAKDLTTKLRPAHQRVLAKLHEAGAATKEVDKDKFAKVVGTKADDAKYASVFNDLYSLNLITWSEEGKITLTDASANYVVANEESFDKETAFSELEHEKPKRVKSTGNGGERTRVGDDKIIRIAQKDGKAIDNPCNPAKERHNHFNAIKDGGTVGEYKKAGGNAFNLKFFVEKGYVTLEDAPAAAAK